MNFFRWFLLHGLVICSKTAFAAAGDEDSINVVTDKEKKSYDAYMDLNESFAYGHSHKIPLNIGSSDPYRYHAADAHLIEFLAKASLSSFHKSLNTSPIIQYERPGYVFMDDELHGVCAEFRAMKNSVDPAAYSRQEKLKFLDKIIELGVFTDFEAVSALPVKGRNNNNKKMKDHLTFRGIFSSSVMTSHFCRDALRLTANVLNSSQIAWLLENSTESIVYNPELLDQLEDFSMFSKGHAVKAFLDGHYDWFKNSKALMTLKARVLMALISDLNYDLNFEQLTLLNSARPIEELFKTPEFYGNPFVWQITAGTPHFRDEYIKIDALVDLIENFEGEEEEDDENLLSEELKQVVIGLYVHSEISINNHINSLLSLAKGEEGVPANSEASTVEDKIKFHFDALKEIFTQCQTITLFLIERNSESSSDDLEILTGLFFIPSTYAVRSAVRLIEEVKGEHPNLEEVEIRDFIKILNDPKNQSVFSKPIALILAFCELKFKTLEAPYRDVWESKVNTTIEIIETFLSISASEEFLSLIKWTRIFLIQQAHDFRISQPFCAEDKDETLKIIFEDHLSFCNLMGFSEFEIQSLKLNFPEYSADLIETIEEIDSLESKYDEFKENFLVYLEKYKIAILEIEKFLRATMSIAVFECNLMAIIQNSFEPEMAKLLIEDESFLTEFSDFSHLLKRSQVAELLENEEGRRLLSESRTFLHNLPTFEDFKAEDVKSLKFQAQYATMVRTLPLIPLLTSFEQDEYIFNDPLALSWRLFGKFERLENGFSELLNSVWRFVPLQMLAESWKTGDEKIDKFNLCNNSGIQVILRTSGEVDGKPLEALKEILHWAILEEIKFLETFLFINIPRESFKWVDAFKSAVALDKHEHVNRNYIIDTWIHAISRHPEIQSKLRSNFLFDLLEIIGGPLSQVRGGVYLASRKIMDKNLNMINFSECFVGFHPWTNKMLEEVKLKPKIVDLNKLPAESESYSVTDNKVTRDHRDDETTSTSIKCKEDGAKKKNADFKVVRNPNSKKNSHTNIPQYREYLEHEIINRQNLIIAMLSELDSVTSSDSHAQLWVDRVKLLGMFSADGFTMSPNFDLEEPFFNLPLHEMILYKKLRTMSRVDENEDNMAEDMRPANLATTIIQFVDKSDKNA